MHALDTTATPDPAAGQPPSLAGLRREIDGIDDAIHDLLMRRADVVQRVAALGRTGKIPFRPGREADVITRLLARHTGPLARRAIVRWWREMYASHIGIETAFTIAVCGDLADVAREQFGALTPLRLRAHAAEVIDDVIAGRATAGVLPMPAAGDWWPSRLGSAHIVQRLPLWLPRPDGAPTAEALVVAAAPTDPSTNDRTVIATRADVTGATVLARAPEGALVDVAGYVAADDPAVGALLGGVVLGHYAAQITQ